MLRIGSRGLNVKKLQRHLKVLAGVNLYQDGIFGRRTLQALNNYQEITKIPRTNSATREVLELIEKLVTPLFKIWIDAGHGGKYKRGNSLIYVTSPSKQYYHHGKQYHSGGWFWEGVENRIIADAAYDALVELGYNPYKIYHDVYDTALSTRAKIVRDDVEAGKFGWMHSFHTNAISTDNPKHILERTTGYCLFTTRGQNISDEVGQIAYDEIKNIHKDWRILKRDDDGDDDWEADFKILRETDLKSVRSVVASTLEEYGFMTSSKDCDKIFATRQLRLQAFVNTTKRVYNHMVNYNYA